MWRYSDSGQPSHRNLEAAAWAATIAWALRSGLSTWACALAEYAQIFRFIAGWIYFDGTQAGANDVIRVSAGSRSAWSKVSHLLH